MLLLYFCWLDCVAWGTELKSPYCEDVIAQERVQRKFTRLLPGFERYYFKEKAGVRRLGGDLSEVYKIMSGVHMIDNNNLYPMVGCQSQKGMSERFMV